MIRATKKKKPKTRKPKYEPLLKMPPLSPEEYEGLRASISVSGVLIPILVDCDGPRRKIIDGNHRKQIADELGYDCPEAVLRNLSEEEYRAMARAVNLARRQLNTTQKREIIAQQLHETPQHSNRVVGKMLGVHHATVSSVRADLEATGQFIQLERTIGADGKSRPAKRKTHVLHQLADFDEQTVLSAAREIRRSRNQERVAEQQAVEAKTRAKARNGRGSVITAEQKVIKADLLLADPPFGITNEPWEPHDLEAFTREWCSRWSKCGADFIAIYWSQERLWDARKWFDEALGGYDFQQMLVWAASNTAQFKSRKCLKQSWTPILLYRRKGSKRLVIHRKKPITADLHNMDYCLAAIPKVRYRGENLRQHPCQKPVAVMRWLVNALSEPGELVVSPFAGSAPCGIAALQLGRRYHGIEINRRYRKIAEARLATYGRIE